MTRAIAAVAALGALFMASSAQGVPSAGPGYVATLQVSYDSPPFPDSRYRVTITLEGDVCGNPFTGTWQFSGTRTGGPSNPPPTLAPVTFAAANPVVVTGDRWFDASNNEIARIDVSLRFTPGSPPVLTPSWTTSGDILNVVATPPQVAATAQTIADCPAAQPPPPPPSPPPPPPSATPTGTASGTVLVNGRRYVSGRPIPYGSKVDVTSGRLALETELGDVTVYGGGGVSSVFRISRVREPTDLIEMRLVGGNFASCKKRALAAAGAKPVRRLWANGKGKFRTKGRYASAAIRGTWWLTADDCDRTLVRARQGSLTVRDFAKGKTVIVKAPKSYSAAPRRR